MLNDETMYEEVDRRISELQRDGWHWVKQGPTQPQTMCAVMDSYSIGKPGYSGRSQRLSNDTVHAIDAWLRDRTNDKFQGVVHWNDSFDGAKDVGDVVEMLEKFRAELQ